MACQISIETCGEVSAHTFTKMCQLYMLVVTPAVLEKKNEQDFAGWRVRRIFQPVAAVSGNWSWFVPNCQWSWSYALWNARAATTLLRRCHRLREKADREERSAKLFHRKPTRDLLKWLITNSAIFEAGSTHLSNAHAPAAVRSHDLNSPIDVSNRKFNVRFAKGRDVSPDRHHICLAKNLVSRKFAYELRIAKPLYCPTTCCSCSFSFYLFILKHRDFQRFSAQNLPSPIQRTTTSWFLSAFRKWVGEQHHPAAHNFRMLFYLNDGLQANWLKIAFK